MNDCDTMMDDHSHIDYADLSRFADGDLGRRRSASIRAHLEVCADCRDEVQFIQTLGAGIRSLPNPRVPARLIHEVLPDVPTESDENGAVPLFDSRRAGPGLVPRSRRAAAASIAVIGAVALLTAVFANRAAAGARSMLAFEQTRAGALELRYETTSALASERSLRARVRYWVPESLRFTQVEPGFSEIELSRAGAGRFEGVLDLPPGTVYAAVVVEDRDGNRIDANRGRYWEYLERDERGQPTLRSRLHQVLAMEQLAPSSVVEVAEQAAAEFPARPEFWKTLLLFGGGAPTATAETDLRTHTERLDVLDAAARGMEPGPVAMHALSAYARLLDRPELEAYWLGRLVERHPRHEYASQERRRTILRSSGSNRERLGALDFNWHFSPMPATAQLGLRLSYEFADPALTERWLGRYRASTALRSLRYDVLTAERLAAVPALHSLAEGWTAERLEDGRDWRGSLRYLDQTRANFEAETLESRARLHLHLARVRLARGDTVGAVEAVERSVERGWNAEVFAEAARIHNAVGSRGRASELLAFVEVDPVTPSQPYLYASDGWSGLEPREAQLATARAALRAHVRRGLLNNQRVDLETRLQAPSGKETTLREVTSGGVTLVIQTIWPQTVSLEALDLIESNAQDLESAGARALFVAEEPDPASDRGPASRVTPAFHYDVDHEVWDALGAWRTEQYFVLGAGGWLRYRGEDPAAALRIAIVLGNDASIPQVTEELEPGGKAK